MAAAAPPDPGDPGRWAGDVALADGGTVHLRLVGPGDEARLVAFHERQSPDSVYQRYFTAMPTLTPRMLDTLVGVDFTDHVALVAEFGEDVVAVGVLDRWPGTTTGEVAFMVDGAHRGRGLATLLLEYLVAAAREVGFESLVAITLPSNQSMLGVFTRAGFETGRTFAEGLIEVTFALEPDEATAELIERRSAAAAARSVARLVSPGSVAVVGAGRDPSGLGHQLFVNLRDGGFAGPVYPVNASGGPVAGSDSWERVVDIPDEVALAIVCVPAEAVPAVVADCARKRVRGLVVVSAGIADPEGLVTQARRWGMRVLGPESLGVVNTDPSVAMTATYADVDITAGPVGLLVQSGTLGVAALELAARRGVGISTFVDVGAKADVSGNDVLEFWESDPATRVALLYLESFGNPRKFVRIARRMASQTPIVAVKAGDRRPERRGSGLWPEAATYGALLRQCGVVRVDTLRQLFDVGRVLLHQPVPNGWRVAVVSNSLGATALTVDACVAAGLEIAPPVALPFDAVPADYADAVSSVAAEVDALVVVYAPAMGDERRAVAEAVAGAVPDGCTAVATFLRPGGGAPVLAHAGLPIFDFPEEAAGVLGRLAEHGAWRAQDPGTPPVALPEEVLVPVRALVASVLAEEPTGRWLRWDEVSRLAAAAGWPLAAAEVAGDLPAVTAAAERLGYPVALKAVDRRPLFRSAVGGVVLDLRSLEEVAAAYARLGEAARDESGDGTPVALEVLVQRMAPDGVDVGMAVHQHPEVGAVASMGLGGIAAVADRNPPVALVPLTDADAGRLVAASRAGGMLEAADPSGSASRHVAVLVGSLAALADEVPELADVVADPVLVGPGGATITDLRIRVAPAAPDRGPDVRRL